VALMAMTKTGQHLREVAPPSVVVDYLPLFLSPGFAWAADSRAILFAGKGETPFPMLCRADLSGGPAATVSSTLPVQGIQQLAIAGLRLAYTIPAPRSTIWRYQLGDGHRVAVQKAVANSPHVQSDPAISSDGRQFAFSSNRSGTWHIYTADSEGKSPRQLTSMGGAGAGWAQWSPDGRRIAFDVRPNGRAQVYVVDAEGGTPQQLTSTSSDAVMPMWSLDEVWIYYTLLDPAGSSDIWKVPAKGGVSVRVTSMNDAFGAYPSPDGARLYVGNRSGSAVYSVPLNGERPARVAGLDGAAAGRMAITGSGIFFIGKVPGEQAFRQLMYYHFAKGLVERLMLLPAPVVFPAIAASLDEKQLLLTQDDGTMSQVLLVENFR
jgi:dipeptidyl aminopeptidase/acylaminoacyl peptidase